MTHFCLGMIRKSCILQKSYVFWNYLFSSWLLLANTNKNQTKQVAWDQAPQWGRGKKWDEGGGKGGEPGDGHAFDSLPFHRYALISQMSQCWQICGAVDTRNIMLFRSSWQIHGAVDIWNIMLFWFGKELCFYTQISSKQYKFQRQLYGENICCRNDYYFYVILSRHIL